MIRSHVVVKPIRWTQRQENRCRRRGCAENELMRPLPGVFADLLAEFLTSFVVSRPVDPAPDARHAAGFGGRCKTRISPLNRLGQLPLFAEKLVHLHPPVQSRTPHANPPRPPPAPPHTPRPRHIPSRLPR